MTEFKQQLAWSKQSIDLGSTCTQTHSLLKLAVGKEAMNITQTFGVLKLPE
jgi:hypothetical protein